MIALTGGSHGAGLAYLLDMNRVAAAKVRRGYPDGAKRCGRGTSGITRVASPSWTMVRQMALLRTLAEDLSRDLNIDPRRVYVTGFSNGGFMTQRVAREAADTRRLRQRERDGGRGLLGL